MSGTHYLKVAIGLKRPPYSFMVDTQGKFKKSAMTRAEAQELIKKASHASTIVFSSVVQLMARGGYRALGFAKPQDCLRKRLPHISNSYICRLLKATDTYLTVDPTLTYLSLVSESTFRPMQHLKPDQLHAIWNWVLKYRYKNNHRITSGMITEALDAMNILSYEHCVNNHHGGITIRMDADLMPLFSRHIVRITEAFRTQNVNSREEWRQMARLVYQQILRNCPSA